MEICPDSMNTIRTVWPLGLKWDAFGIRLMPVLSPDLESVHRGVLFYFKCPAATLPDLKDCRLPNVMRAALSSAGHQSRKIHG